MHHEKCTLEIILIVSRVLCSRSATPIGCHLRVQRRESYECIDIAESLKNGRIRQNTRAPCPEHPLSNFLTPISSAGGDTEEAL